MPTAGEIDIFFLDGSYVCLKDIPPFSEPNYSFTTGPIIVKREFILSGKTARGL